MTDKDMVRRWVESPAEPVPSGPDRAEQLERRLTANSERIARDLINGSDPEWTAHIERIRAPLTEEMHERTRKISATVDHFCDTMLRPVRMLQILADKADRINEYGSQIISFGREVEGRNSQRIPFYGRTDSAPATPETERREGDIVTSSHVLRKEGNTTIYLT